MSHLETLDYEPKLVELDGQPMPPSITQGQPIAQLQGEELIPAWCPPGMHRDFYQRIPSLANSL